MSKDHSRSRNGADSVPSSFARVGSTSSFPEGYGSGQSSTWNSQGSSQLSDPFEHDSLLPIDVLEDASFLMTGNSKATLPTQGVRKPVDDFFRKFRQRLVKAKTVRPQKTNDVVLEARADRRRETLPVNKEEDIGDVDIMAAMQTCVVCGESPCSCH